MKMPAENGTGYAALQEMVEILGYREVCARWVRRWLAERHKVQRSKVSSQLLERYDY